MVNPGALIGAGSLLLSLRQNKQTQEIQKQLNDDSVPNGSIDMPPDVDRLDEIETDAERVAQAVERLAALEETQQPRPEDKDAYASAVIELGDGDTATVTVTPDDGFNLRVREIYFDRKADHDYTFNVGGDISSVTHRAKYSKPKLVSQSDVLTAEVTNNSGSNTVVDFELEAWAEAVR